MSAELCALQDAGSAHYIIPSTGYAVSGDEITRCNADIPHILRPVNLWDLVSDQRNAS